jgi:hypothetical protein
MLGHARPSSSLDGETSYKKARYEPERKPVKIPEVQVRQIGCIDILNPRNASEADHLSFSPR